MLSKVRLDELPVPEYGRTPSIQASLLKKRKRGQSLLLLWVSLNQAGPVIGGIQGVSLKGNGGCPCYSTGESFGCCILGWMLYVGLDVN
jgi:hypothetical protein